MTVEQQINQANAQVMEILLKGQPVWVDVKPAIEAIPGMTKNTVFHPGPPYENADEIPTPIRNSICGALNQFFDPEADAAWLARYLLRQHGGVVWLYYARRARQRGEISAQSSVDFGILCLPREAQGAT